MSIKHIIFYTTTMGKSESYSKIKRKDYSKVPIGHTIDFILPGIRKSEPYSEIKRGKKITRYYMCDTTERTEFYYVITTEKIMARLMNISVDCLLHPFVHKWLTYILVDRFLSVCAQTVDPSIGIKKEKKIR